jgi:hypothetical protein
MASPATGFIWVAAFALKKPLALPLPKLEN